MFFNRNTNEADVLSLVFSLFHGTIQKNQVSVCLSVLKLIGKLIVAAKSSFGISKNLSFTRAITV
jgi:hypothetical protein